MDLPRVTSQEEWLAARGELLTREQEVAREREALVAERRRLPMVEIAEDYAFETPDGRVGLLGLFAGRRQLLVYHFWFQPGESPCEGCSSWIRNLGDIPSLYEKDTSFTLVSPAPLAEIETVKVRRGWTVPWVSLIGDGFNAEVGYVGEPQITVLLRDGDTAYRTYSTSGRILETLSSHWSLLDLTPLSQD